MDHIVIIRSASFVTDLTQAVSGRRFNLYCSSESVSQDFSLRAR